MLDAIVLGAGISGLATGFWLKRKGLNFKILEAGSHAGGAVKTLKKDGFIFDMGPNSALETTPVIKELTDSLGITHKMIYASEYAQKRYILRGGSLIPLPTGPASFMQSRLFSWSAKLNLMKEPFIPAANKGYEESVADFVTRRLGSEFLDYAIDPFVSGVTAGDPARLSVKSAFPKLYQLEEQYGSILKGAVKGAKERKKNKETSKQSTRMFSFENGLQQLTDALASELQNELKYDQPALEIRHEEKRYEITLPDKSTLQTKSLISTIPAYQLGRIMKFESEPEVKHLLAIPYPPVLVLYLGYRLEDIGRPLDGFGFLIPTKEKRKFLGAIWSSTIFPNRAPEGFASFNLFIGGARHQDLKRTHFDEAYLKNVIDEFQEIMKINTAPFFRESMFWPLAIPQYTLDHHLHDNVFSDLEKYNQGFFISGNFRGGISFSDCIKNSKLNAERMISYLEKV